MQRFQDMAVGYAYAVLGDYHLAEDAAQEAFIAAWYLLSQLHEPEAFPAWLRRIVFKYCDRIRRKPQLGTLPFEDALEIASHAPGPAATVETLDWREQVRNAVSFLPDAERQVVVLYYFADESQAAIARFLAVPESTVKSRLFTARKKLERRMLPMLHDPAPLERPSHDEKFARRIQSMIRPNDRELGGGGGSQSCDGAAIWEMICAAVAGDVTAVKALLQRDPRLATAQYWYTEPLHYAVREGHAEVVQLLLAHGADPTHIRYAGEDLRTVARDRGHEAVAQFIEAAQEARLGGKVAAHEIHGAAATSDTDRVQALLGEDASLANLVDSHGRTPLHLAANANSLSVVEALLDAGANIEALTGAGGAYLPANFAAADFALWDSDWWLGKRHWPELLDLLLARGAADDATVAAARGDAARLQQLLDEDPSNANYARPAGRRPLSTAIQFGHLELAKQLLAAGADPNLPEGRNIACGAALYFAARDRHYEMVDLLLQHGARPDGSIDSCGFVYHVADDLIRLKLYTHGLEVAEVDITNVDALALWAQKAPDELAHTGCGTIFTYICSTQRTDEEKRKFPDAQQEATLRMLLAKGVRIPPVLTGCRSYLWEKPYLARILLEHGMDPNLPNWQWVTPLHNFCGRDGRGRPDPNRLELAALFLEFGADLNARDEEYRSTPLAWAARNNLPDMVEFLLSQGAATNLPDDEPWATPFAWAKKRGHQEIIDLLQTAGAKA